MKKRDDEFFTGAALAAQQALDRGHRYGIAGYIPPFAALSPAVTQFVILVKCTGRGPASRSFDAIVFQVPSSLTAADVVAAVGGSQGTLARAFKTPGTRRLRFHIPLDVAAP